MLPADVGVIGAGVAGASVAAQLARRGYAVAIIERDAVGAGASGRNAGSIIFPPDPSFIDLYDEPLARYAELAASSEGRFPGVTATGALAITKDVQVASRLTDHLRADRPELEAELLGWGTRCRPRSRTGAR